MMQNSKQSEMILHDNLWKVMIKLSFPAVCAMILHGLNLVCDGIFVGKFVGNIALSGVSVAYPLTQIAVGFGSMLGGGAAACLSIAIGKKDKETQNKILGNTNFLGVLISLVLMLALYLLSRPLMMFMGGEGEVLEIGLSYFRITIIGTVVWVFSLAYNLIIRAEGKMGTAALIMGLGLAVNIIANYILIAVLKFGVAGAAWGTNLGMFVYTLLGIIYFRRGKASFEAAVFSFRKDKKIVQKIFSLGMPSLIMTFMNLIGGVVILNAIGAVGTDYDIGFYGATLRIMTFMMTPLTALMRSLQPTVGMNYGAKQYDRVIKGTLVYIAGGLMIILPVYLITMTMPETILGLMLDGAISAANIFNFRILISIIPLLAIVFNGMSYFPAIDNGKTAGGIAIFRQVIFYLPAMIVLPRLFGLKYVYIGSFAIDVLFTVVLVVLLLKSFVELEKKRN